MLSEQVSRVIQILVGDTSLIQKSVKTGAVFWAEADRIKRLLFNRLRQLTRIDYKGYRRYRQAFAAIPDQLVKEWQEAEKRSLKRLKGYLFEALFYFACLESQAAFLDAELAEFGGATFERSPPWIEATPLYDIIPSLHQIRREKRWERKVPQTSADFLVTYVNDSGPSPPSLVDVKSRPPKRKEIKRKMGWQITAAMRRGFIFQVAYPKDHTEFPKSLDDWEIRTPCSSCGALSKQYDKCEACNATIFSFSIVSGHYEAKELWKTLGKTRSGRF